MTIVLISVAGAFIFVFAMRQAERSPNWPTQLGWVVVSLFVPVVIVAAKLVALLDHQVVIVR